MCPVLEHGTDRQYGGGTLEQAAHFPQFFGNKKGRQIWAVSVPDQGLASGDDKNSEPVFCGDGLPAPSGNGAASHENYRLTRI